MAKQRLRKRASHEDERINVLRPNADASAWIVFQYVSLAKALIKIARREWTALWYEDGRLAGVQFLPPPIRPGELVQIRCGSVECRKGWIMSARRRAPAASKVTKSDPLRMLLDFFDEDLETKLKRVSVELALKKIALDQWRALWNENGELAGVAAA